MKVIMWNIRGMGRLPRLRQLKEMIARESPDILGLQETIKQNFSEHELESLAPGRGYKWGWIEALGHSGGILLGVKDGILEVEDWDSLKFFMRVTVKHRIDNIRWECLSVYGPAQHEKAQEFLEELSLKCERVILPLLLGGDFNLIRGVNEKNSGRGDAKLIRAFNSFIEKFDLREIYRGGGGYT